MLACHYNYYYYVLSCTFTFTEDNITLHTCEKKPRILQKRKANPIDQQFQPFFPQSWMINVRSMQEDNRMDQLIIVETTLFFSIIHLKTEEENDTKKTHQIFQLCGQ